MTRKPQPAAREAPPRSYGLPIAYGVFVVLVVAVSPTLDLPAAPIAGLLALATIVYALRKRIYSWRFLLFSVLAMIMFVPARAYALPVPLPFQLEPYRVLWIIGLGVVLWAVFVRGSLRWRQTMIGPGLLFYLFTILVSFAFNASELTRKGLINGAVGGIVTFLMLLVPLVIVRQLLDSESIVKRVLVFLTWSAATVSLFALFEYATRINVFRTYAYFLPLHLLRDELEATTTIGAFRAFGSAQHPIALVVMLATLIPAAIWLANWSDWPKNPINRRIFYGVITLILFAGMMSAISRTAVVVLASMFAVVLLLRPRVASLLAVLSIPPLILVALVRPNVFNTVFLSFLDLDNLVASQYTSPGWAGQGRLADIGPALEIVAQQPFFGSALGSRIVVGENANSFILDNQWLAILMELGILGVVGLALFILTPAVLLIKHAHTPGVPASHRDLAIAVATATIGYAVAMYFFDAFSFIQSFLVLSMLWAVGGWLLTDAAREGEWVATQGVGAAL